MHYVTDQPAIISKIYPKLQVLTFHFFEVDELLNENWAKIVLSENISTPIHVQCDKMYQSKVCVQEFWYFVSGLDIRPEQSKNDNPAPKKLVQGCEKQRFNYLFSQQIDTKLWLTTRLSC